MTMPTCKDKHIFNSQPEKQQKQEKEGHAYPKATYNFYFGIINRDCLLIISLCQPILVGLKFFSSSYSKAGLSVPLHQVAPLH